MYFRLDEGLYMVGGGSGGPGISHFKDCNIYLIVGEKDAFLIDGGATASYFYGPLRPEKA